MFDICSEHARRAEFVPAMRNKVMRFEVVEEDEWQARLNGMLFWGAGLGDWGGPVRRDR